jgi:hypothetical protein
MAEKNVKTLGFKSVSLFYLVHLYPMRCTIQIRCETCLPIGSFYPRKGELSHVDGRYDVDLFCGRGDAAGVLGALVTVSRSLAERRRSRRGTL